MVLDKNQHRLILFFILKDIFESNISKDLAFKGGTLCYFVYGLNRFSTDIDLDMLTKGEEEKIIETINNILRKYGKIKDFENKKNTIFWLLNYEKGKDNIKIEINKRIWKNNNYEIINFFGIDIWAQTKDTIFANKLVALLERKKIANRDIYDVRFFLKNGWPCNKKLIQERTGKTFDEYITQVIEFLNNLGRNYKILDGLGMVLENAQKNFVKNKLINELISLLKLYKLG